MKSEPIQRAGRILAEGGVVAYPTEGVYGLGCIPESLEGAARIITMKRRDPAAGMILVAARPDQLDPWVAPEVDLGALESSLEHPVTWIVKPGDAVPWWVTGDHAGIAVRLTAHPVAAALCDAADSALTSTSANVAGRRPARNVHVLRRDFRDLVDAIVPGACGPAGGPSEIRILETGEILRAGTQ